MLKDYFEVPNKPAIKSGNILSCDFTDHETFIPQPLDYSRGTLATYVDCNGLIKISGVSDTELVTNGDFATDSDWNKGTGWIINDGKAINTGGANFSDLTQNNTNVTIGKTYKITYTISDYTSGSIKFIMNNNSAAGVERNANGTYTDYISALSQGYSFRTQGSGFIGKIDNVSVKQVDVETPRIDYLTEINKSKELQQPSLLLEPQSTNLFWYSEEFSHSYWNKTNCTVQQSTITSPDGLQGSYKLIPDAGTGGNRSLGRNFNSLSNFHTWSIFARAGEYKYAILRTRNGPIAAVAFDLENGTFNVNQSSAVYVADSAKIENYGNGWYRCSITLDPSQSNIVGQLYPSISVGITGNETDNFDGDGVSGIYVFGAQVEEQSYSTSYIPTSGSTVTRNQDLANNAGSAPVFNSEEGVLYCEIAALANDGTFREITLNDGTTSNAIEIRYVSTSNRLQCVARSGGGVTASLEFDLSNTTEFVKAALSYKANNFKMYLNGSLVATDTSGATPVGLNRLSFNWGGFNFFYGKTKEVKVFRRALTDAELTELTNNIT